jgi:hypothetical protein
LPKAGFYDVDSGYFTLLEMRRHSQDGVYWLAPAKASVQFYDRRGVCWDLVSFLREQTGDEVDLPVWLGVKERVPARLLAKRVSETEAKRRREVANQPVEGKPKGVQRLGANSRRPQPQKRPRFQKRKKVGPARLELLGWTILVTNVPAELLTLDEALIFARCRWQIELCWKLWKQVGKLDTWRSAKPERILTEMYAKLLGLLIAHWLTLLECWQAPNRSLVKARQVVAWMAPALALGVAGVVSLETMVERTSATMASGCTVESRRKRPATYQLVADPKLIHS